MSVEPQRPVKLTRGTKKIIEEAIKSVEPEKRNNRIVLCARIAQMLEERFEGDNLTYQLKRMDLQTTGKILEKIDMYWYKYGSRINQMMSQTEER
ncbi:hypothetical protein [Caldibacillus debilis]|uniref:Uncharacterized protein n=1 Tax=Caldibacillus debilis GB1 TaxID=1339248 RepID=A0A420VEA9_9BACI|nr:hypothetical protein [Caldibacillus debilis]RKO61850.1 hypothetical protein Cdeb_01345 [Caldibacillus debilis GB1]